MEGGWYNLETTQTPGLTPATPQTWSSEQEEGLVQDRGSKTQSSHLYGSIFSNGEFVLGPCPEHASVCLLPQTSMIWDLQGGRTRWVSGPSCGARVGINKGKDRTDACRNFSFGTLTASLNTFCSSLPAAVSSLNGCSGPWRRSLVQPLPSRWKKKGWSEVSLVLGDSAGIAEWPILPSEWGWRALPSRARSPGQTPMVQCWPGDFWLTQEVHDLLLCVKPCLLKHYKQTFILCGHWFFPFLREKCNECTGSSSCEI